MVRSGLPFASVLILFSPLLVLSQELPLFLPPDLTDLPLTHQGVIDAINFARDTYNQRRPQSANYFKVLNVVRAKTQLSKREEYHLWMTLAETRCKKPSFVSNPELVTNCEPLPGNDKIKRCYFKVILRSPQNVAVTACF